MADVFEFQDYRLYMRSQINANESIRGYQSRLSQAAGCKRSFLSQVLHTHINLTPDHGAGLCQFWNFNEDETDWFMELLAISRAGSNQMRKLCQRRLDTLKNKRANLVERLKPSTLLPKEAQLRYYTSWYLAAIHIITCIPSYNSVREIASRLNLREELVHNTLLSLEQMGLVENKGQCWRSTERDIHLPKSSTLNLVNHTNWRQQAIYKIQLNEKDSFHYTAIHALSLEDIAKVQEKLIDAIRETRKIVTPSREEELVCLTCDLFKV